METSGNEITLKRCYNHAAREAAARCPECQRFFCRECVTEHDDRVLCASCLQQSQQTDGRTGALLSTGMRIVSAFGGLLLSWVFFYWLALMLLAIPAPFHEGTVWEGVAEIFR